MALGRLTTARVAFVVATILWMPGCSGESSSTEDAGHSARTPIRINGMGATLPYPLYSKWFAEYNRLHPDVQINYQSQGSGAGIRGLMTGTVFFGASDQPMTDAQLAAASGRVWHFPTVVGAVVPVYNLPGNPPDLLFTGTVLADIVLGRITTWNDGAIARLNPAVSLPPLAITLVHRADGSGTTFVWSDYLSKVSPAFKANVGADASLRWPVGLGAKGNEGMTAMVQQTPGALGYVELVWAQQNRLPFGAVRNAAGVFVKASLASVAAAAEEAAVTMPSDFRISVTNAPGAAAYPIASFTWLLMRDNPDDPRRPRLMREFLRWALTDGQRYATDLGYASLPRPIVDMELKTLDSLAEP